MTYYGKFTETPSVLITGILTREVATGNESILCKPCFLETEDLEESSLSTLTAQPQPDLILSAATFNQIKA